MSNFDEKNTGPAEKLTVAGIAAIIVVGVFVVCVILILAKSLFPSNDNSVPDGEYTGTKPAETQSTAEPEQVIPDDGSNVTVNLDESGTDTSSTGDDSQNSAADSNSSDTSSQSGEIGYLTQTAYLRSSGDENGEPLLSISAGEEVTILERPADSEYVKVDYYGTQGWIWNGYLG